MPARPARLTRRRDDDLEVKGRAPAWGESWIPPLDPERADDPLEAPAFDDALDEDDEPGGQGGEESGRVASGGQGGDEVMAGESIASEEPDPFGDDLLVGSVAPDH